MATSKKQQLLEEYAKEASEEISQISRLNENIASLNDTIKDQNEELIATYVEGTKRLLNKKQSDLAPDLKKLEESVKSSLSGLKTGAGNIERAVKSINLSSLNNILLEARTSKNNLKKLVDGLNKLKIDLPKEAKDAIAVRLSDGERFYNALETIATFASGGGGGGGAPEYNEGSKISTIRGHAWLAEGPSDVLFAPRTNSSGYLYADQAVSNGSNSVFNSADLDESEEQVKATAGTIWSIYVWNTTDAPLWLKAYNKTAANVTVGTTACDYDVMIPANGNSDGAGFVLPVPTGGWPFSTAITLAATTGRGTTDSGAPGAGACGVLVFYV